MWTDHRTTGVEDQYKFAVPINRDTEKIYYQQRFIIDNAVYTEPRCWHISKINRVAPNGIVIATMAQTVFDENNDRCEIIDLDGTHYYKALNELSPTDNIVAWWPDYQISKIEPKDFTTDIPSNIRSEISYSGLRSELKSNGSYKKFTVTYYNGDTEITYVPGTFTYTIDGVDASSLIKVLTSADSTDLNPNQIKIKFIGGDKYIGSILKLTHTDGTITSDLEIEIVSL